MNNTLNTSHRTPQYFSNPLHPITISIVGCGGTGSLLIARIARLNYYLRAKGLPGIHLSAYDDDFFEEKNIGRQQCTPFDLGENKAHNCIKKVNLAYGFQWDALDYRVSKMPKTNIIITAVDNIKLRNTIHKEVKKAQEVIYENEIDYSTPLYWLDTGNGKDFGQVVLSTIKNTQENNKLNTIIDIFGALEKSDNFEKQQTRNCSQIAIEEEQDLFINDAIAVDAIQIIQNVLLKSTIEFQGTVSNRKSFKANGLKINSL